MNFGRFCHSLLMKLNMSIVDVVKQFNCTAKETWKPDWNGSN